MKIILLLNFILITGLSFAQIEPIKIKGYAQGTTYHITYYDSLKRNLQPEIEKILQDFDQSVSTYLPTSTISMINRNEKGVKADAYFIACFNKAK
ncbi:MAG: FAD:protein FMN transferase, partial [Bacteroidia bacterium]|nr:FAD:protein FMN transferase [Bacteroidia bacterium]